MGSGDLNMKKSWHPQRSGNVAATQKAEAEAISERKKLQLRLQEIEEERKKEEIQKTLEAAGGKRKIDRVEWMYAGPTDGQVGDSAESEAYLLGKRRIDKLLQDNEVKKLARQPSQDDLVAVSTINNARDIATKIREDPLLAIKKQEQQAYEAMMNDPIKRRQLLASIGIEDTQQKPKREKHRHHHRSSRHHRDDRESERRSHRRRSNSKDRSPSPRRDRSRSPRRARSRSLRRDKSRSPRRHSGEEDERTRRRRDSPDRRRSSPDRKRHRFEPDDERYRRDRREDSQSQRPRDSRKREESRSPSPPPRRRDRSPERNAPPRRPYDDRAPYRPRKDYDRDSKQARQQIGGPPAPDPGQAEQERARKLAAMQAAATDLDKDREKRLATIEAADRAQREADDKIRQRNKKLGGTAGFVNDLHSRAVDIKVADRMGRAL
ncbi:Pre-mRNA splicing factor-domain-containing protein [Lasiosphaeris hirsuta]|uniref:Pre-mRNA splicing factor-domain-containing protein n=1 Tax=Lasiosphaeris hirsuta TaxID=260670 RepID=A0AA40E6I7_9PEZI|nr:Pre-mRNA splicing factor-domain-containing protein [Lasiosphaeris hirsuta]